MYAPVILLLTKHAGRVAELNSQEPPVTPEDRKPWNKELKNLSLTIMLMVVVYLFTVVLFVA